MDMEAERLEFKSKWSDTWKEMPCRPSDCFPKGVVLLRMIVPARDKRKSNLQ
jgi:hypothetical protein